MTGRGPVLAAVAVAMCLAVAGCSSSGSSPSGSSPTGASAASTSSSADSAAFPVTIDSAVGKATITTAPKRVVAIGWGSQDVALALGVVPVGMQDLSGDTGVDSGIMPWDSPKLKGAEPALLKYTTGDVPYEQIAALRPDVILAVDSGVTTAEYAKLTKIAPTVGYPGKPWLTSWQDQLSIVGKALGRSAEAARLKAQTDALIARAKADHPEFAGKTVAFGSGTTTSAFNLYLATDSRVQLLHELGFAVSPSLPSSAASFAVPLSLEKLNTINADVLVAWYLSASVRKQIESSALFDKIPAVARKGYVPLTDPSMVYATSAVSVLSLPWMLDRYLPLLSAAAQGKGAS